MGHLVNHVPSGKHPNVIQIPFDFSSNTTGENGFPTRFRKYVPNSYAKQPTLLGTFDRSAFMQTMVLLTTRPLKDNDELFMNYRLNSSSSSTPLPEWYAAYVDPNEEGTEEGAVRLPSSDIAPK